MRPELITPGPAPPPEWVGWLLLFVLVSVFSVAVCLLLAAWASRDFSEVYQRWELGPHWKPQRREPLIQINKQPGQRVLELGGGENRHPQADVMVDVRQLPGVDFVVDFNETPWPIGSDEFDCVYASFVLEHLPFTKTAGFLGECLRVLKPGGCLLLVLPNTAAQFEWIKSNPAGWDGKDFFTSASEVLFGSQTYAANFHAAYFDPDSVTTLLRSAGFEDVVVRPFNPRGTDMVVEATRPRPREAVQLTPVAEEAPAAPPPPPPPTPAEIFDRDYFNTAARNGGYGPPGYRDFPAHEFTLRHVLARKPDTVLEIGCARGYVLKRLQDAGVNSFGLDVSRHCWLTRACDGIVAHDLCQTPWPLVAAGHEMHFDLCFSVAVLEHLPEQALPAVIREMARTCKRGLHGVGFEDNPGDRTRVTVRPRDWWLDRFNEHAPGWPVEVVAKDELEAPTAVPREVFEGDGKVKLNLGSFTSMHHHGWVNVDGHDLTAFAQGNLYQFKQHDLRAGLPWPTGGVDLIFSSHCLEHLTYDEGLALLKECRRVLKPATGALRLLVPDAYELIRCYAHDHPIDSCQDHVGTSLSDFNEILSDEKTAARTPAGKLCELLFNGHQAIYDWETLARALEQAGFRPFLSSFRKAADPRTEQIVRETIDVQPEISLVVDAVPLVG